VGWGGVRVYMCYTHQEKMTYIQARGSLANTQYTLQMDFLHG
jgi:hypothetical protein